MSVLRLSPDHGPRRHGASHEQHEASRPNDRASAERVLQTLKQWLAAQTPEPASLTQLRAALDTIGASCNPPALQTVAQAGCR
jgi:hypothetical protein